MKPVYRGDTKRYKITVMVESTNTPLDISGMIIKFTAKSDINLPYDNAEIKKVITSHTDPINGESEVVLLSSDTLLPAANYFAYFTLVDGTNQRITFKEDILPILSSEL